jgi:methionine synthase I (cobalamin-dependent)
MRDLRAALSERILVLDGAMGTMIQAAALSADDFGGPELDGCTSPTATKPTTTRWAASRVRRTAWPPSCGQQSRAAPI